MKTIITSFLVSIAVLALYAIIAPVNLPLGSVTVGNEYSYVTYGTDSTPSSVVKKAPGVLGSVIITGANTGYLTIYAATTTDATKRANVATTSLSVIAQLPSSTAAGTYTFDVSYPIGLMPVWTGNPATSTITYR